MSGAGRRGSSVDAVIGYLHRCHEKLAETLTYVQYPTIASKTDYVAAMSSELAYVMAAEQGMTDVSDVIRPTIVCVLLALFLMVSLGAFLRDVNRAALWVAMGVVLIFGIKFAQRIVGRVVECDSG